MSASPLILSLSLLVAAPLLAASISEACPFCTAQSQTLAEEIATMDAVVVAQLVSRAKPDAADEDLGQAMFQVDSILKGGDAVKVGEQLQTIYFGDAKPGATFLVMAVDPPNLTWSTPLALTKRSVHYVSEAIKLPEKGAKRLEFFQKYLEDKESLLARDAYDEFARAAYPDVLALKPNMDQKQLVGWIKDLDIPASRRRLYLTMLGVCGTEEHLPLLEEMLRSTDRRLKAGLDAMIACYLTLKGPDGLPLIDDLFLKNTETEYSDTYAAIMALRFHGTESDIVPRERILKSLHHMLQRPALADLVIPDLARWEDWSQVDRLVELFKTADEKSSWVKVPVINYLRACPLPVAKQKLAELEKLDPETIERAKTFFPFGPGAKPVGSPAPTESGEPAAAPAVEDDTRFVPRGLPRTFERFVG